VGVDLRHTSAIIPMPIASDEDDAIVVERLSNDVAVTDVGLLVKRWP
jgi:hypothetical protein